MIYGCGVKNGPLMKITQKDLLRRGFILETLEKESCVINSFSCITLSELFLHVTSPEKKYSFDLKS